MDSTQQEPQTQATDQLQGVWRRLHSIAILYFIGSTIKAVVGNMLFVLPAFAISFSQLQKEPMIWLSAISVIFVLMLGSAIINFYFYQYRLHDDSVEIRSGVLAKKNINLPFSKIQNITLEQPFYYRLTGFASVQLDTAGSAKQEAKVVALKLDAANSLKQHILLHKVSTDTSVKTQTNDQQVSHSHDAQGITLNRRSLGDLVIHGITNNRVWIILGVAAPLYGDITEYIAGLLGSMGIDLEQIIHSQNLVWWQLGLFVVSMFVLVSLVLAFISVLGAIFVFYNYQLSKEGNRYIRKSGLLTQQEVSMKLSRLQMIVRKQDWLDLLLGRTNLYLEQNQTGNQNPNAITSANKILVPSVTMDECKLLVRDAFPSSQCFEQQYQSISKRFIFRLVAFWVAPICSIVVGLGIAEQQWHLSVLALLIGTVLSLLVVLRWYRWGYAADGEFIYIRKGLFGVDYICFPIFKIQQTQFHQSVLMKRHNLANCQLILASGSASIPFIPEQIANQLIDQCLYQVEREKRQWM